MRQCRQILAEAPQIVSIFQMWWLANKSFNLEPGYLNLDTSQIRLLLGLSWDNMRVAIRSLQAFVGTDEEKLWVLSSVATVLPGMYSRWRDLAWGCIRVIYLSKCSEIRPQDWIDKMNFGLTLRSSPTCPTLLRALRYISYDLSFDKLYSACLVVSQDLKLYPRELHHILHWLKSFRQPPLDLIELWNGYLETSRRISGSGCSDLELEAPLIEWTEYWNTTLACRSEAFMVDSEDEGDGDDSSIAGEGSDDSQDLLLFWHRYLAT
ncbi:hypothetical protein B0H11DRAFT_2283614 [Mycena galericulata]|nr:hypothetical protein B0H11DRAFT_2283614 [Mycena galericulata]